MAGPPNPRGAGHCCSDAASPAFASPPKFVALAGISTGSELAALDLVHVSIRLSYPRGVDEHVRLVLAHPPGIAKFVEVHAIGVFMEDNELAAFDLNPLGALWTARALPKPKSSGRSAAAHSAGTRIGDEASTSHCPRFGSEESPATL